MRKLILIILAGIFLISLSGCKDVFSWRKYYDREQKFSLKVPRAWEIAEDFQNGEFIINIPNQVANDKFASSVRVAVEDLPGEIALSTYYDMNREEFKRVFKKMGNVTEGQGMSGLYRYQWIAFDSLVTEDVVIRAISYVWMKGKKVYVLTCVMGLRSADKIEPLFRKMAASFRIH